MLIPKGIFVHNNNTTCTGRFYVAFVYLAEKFFSSTSSLLAIGDRYTINQRRSPVKTPRPQRVRRLGHTQRVLGRADNTIGCDLKRVPASRRQRNDSEV
jgi:hypothetical protein